MNFARSATGVLTLNLLTVATSFAGLAYLSRLVAPPVLGSYFLAVSVITVTSSVGLIGIDLGLEKRLSENGDGRFFIAGVALGTIPVAALLLVGIVFAARLSAFTRTPFDLIAVGFLISSILQLLRKGLNGYLQVLDTHLAQFLQQFLFAIISVYLVIRVPNLENPLMTAYIMSSFISLLYAVYKIPLMFVVPQPRHFRSIIEFSKYASISQISIVAHEKVDLLLIGFFLTPSDVSTYEIAWRVSLTISLFANVLSTVIVPNVSSWLESGEKDRISEVLNTASEFTLYLTIPALLGSHLLSTDILSTLFTEDYAAASLVFIILVGQKIPHSLSVIFRAVVHGTDQTKVLAGGGVGFLIVNSVLNIILIPIGGIEGAAVATLTSATATCVYYYLNVSKYVTNIPTWNIVWSIIAGSIMYFSLYAADGWIKADNILTLSMLIGFGVIIYSVVLMSNPDIRNKLAEFKSEAIHE